MRIVIVGLIVLALAAAGGTALLVQRLLDTEAQSRAEAEAQNQAPTTMVLVADNDLPAGTTVTDGDLRWQLWPKDSIGETYVVATEEDPELVAQFVDSVVRRGMLGGTPITAALVFKRDQPGFVAGTLAPGMRAMAVAVKPESSAAGFIRPGDRVDVILTHDLRRDFPTRQGGNPVIRGKVIRYASETILWGVRVVGVDQTFDDFDEEATELKTVTLEVSTKQAETLAVATSMGKLSLALRSLAVDDAGTQRWSFTTDIQVSPSLSATFGDKDAPPPPPPTPPPRVEPMIITVPAPPEPAPPERIKIFRGSQETTRELSDQ